MTVSTIGGGLGTGVVIGISTVENGDMATSVDTNAEVVDNAVVVTAVLGGKVELVVSDA